LNEKCWLDIEVANFEYDLFSAIQVGINQAEVVIICVSDQYAQSNNCQQELLQLVTCKKPIIPIVVGETMRWQLTRCGLLLSMEIYIDFRDPSKFNSNMDILIRRLMKILSSKS